MRAIGAAGMAALALAAGCDRRPAAEAARPPTPRGDPDFLSPPAVTSAERDAAGAVALEGRAPPGARVDLRAPDGAQYAASAGADGTWRLRAPSAATPRAFAMSALAGGRIVRAEGALLLAPAPFEAATLMRGGAPAVPVGAGTGGLRWTSLDTDPGGGAAVSGFAPAGAALRLSIDGVTRGEGAADAAGRFGVLWLGGAVPPGLHTITVSTPTDQRSLAVRFGPAALAGAPVRVAAEDGGWRIDWSPAGGGVQTLHILAPTDATEPAG